MRQCGYLIDRINDPRATTRLFVLSCLLTMFCYAWLAMPPQWTKNPLPGIISFAGGFGFSPRKFCTCTLYCADLLEVLLVVIVPTIVPLKYVSTTLGVHKAVSSTRLRNIQMITCRHSTVGAHWVYHISNARWTLTRQQYFGPRIQALHYTASSLCIFGLQCFATGQSAWPRLP